MSGVQEKIVIYKKRAKDRLKDFFTDLDKQTDVTIVSRDIILPNEEN